MDINLYGLDNFQDLQIELESILKKVEKVEDILEIGASEFVKDLLKLAKPISKIKKAGYTHLIDTFSYVKKKKEIEVGWEKYYGRMVEDGTRKSKSQPHLKPTFEANKNKYYTKMTNQLFD